MVSPKLVTRKPEGPLQVLIPIYPDFNTLDVNGPIEVLSQANRNSETHQFKVTIAAAGELTTSIELVRMARDISLPDAIARIADWDILLVPGGTEKCILSIIKGWQENKDGQGNELMQLLDQYMLDPTGLTFTVCTGGLFLGALGKLSGRKATTHWRSLQTLKRLCADVSDATPTSRIVRARWVDSGDDEKERLPRIITAGGVSCGIDATFHLLDLTVGPELAETAAAIIDYQRRGDELDLNYVIAT